MCRVARPSGSAPGHGARGRYDAGQRRRSLSLLCTEVLMSIRLAGCLVLAAAVAAASCSSSSGAGPSMENDGRGPVADGSADGSADAAVPPDAADAVAPPDAGDTAIDHKLPETASDSGADAPDGSADGPPPDVFHDLFDATADLPPDAGNDVHADSLTDVVACPDGGCPLPCTTDADCQPNHHCVDGLCAPPEPCDSSKDCPGAEVCDKTAGACVQCLTADDCGPGFECKPNQLCYEIFQCDSDKDCKEQGLVCNKLTGICVECVTDLDCPFSSFCGLGGLCLTDACDPTDQWPQCLMGHVVSCSPNGSEFQTLDTCGDGEFCGDGQCQPWVCPPSSSGCMGPAAYECNAEGSDFLAYKDCSVDNQVCENGVCVAVVCVPGKKWCLDPVALATCTDTGSSYTSDFCPQGTWCDAGQGTCIPWVCTPNAKQCSGNSVTVCDMFGSAWSTALDCTTLGQYCSNGQCVQCDPQCGTKVCGPDSCGGSCGTCVPGSECFSGACVQHTCPAACTGASTDAFLCATDICWPGLVSSVQVKAIFGDPLDVMWVAAGGYGTPGNGLVPKVGPSFALLGTGNYSNQQHNDYLAPQNAGAGDMFTSATMWDVVQATVAITAPPGVTGFSVDFLLMSAEWNYGNPMNDKFYLVLTAPQTTGNQAKVINYVPCVNPGYYTAFNENGVPMCYIGALSQLQQPANQLNPGLAGTGYPSSTGWMRTSWPIAAGETFQLLFSIQDTNDEGYDSLIILDNFSWITGSFTKGTVKL